MGKMLIPAGRLNKNWLRRLMPSASTIPNHSLAIPMVVGHDTLRFRHYLTRSTKNLTSITGLFLSFVDCKRLSLFFCQTIQQVKAFAPSTTVKHDTSASVLRMAEGSSVPGPPYSGPASKPILDAVKYPSDMKRLNMRELKQVR